MYFNSYWFWILNDYPGFTGGKCNSSCPDWDKGIINPMEVYIHRYVCIYISVEPEVTESSQWLPTVYGTAKSCWEPRNLSLTFKIQPLLFDIGFDIDTEAKFLTILSVVLVSLTFSQWNIAPSPHLIITSHIFIDAKTTTATVCSRKTRT